jgi:anaerobic sulfite reductase subunit B
MTLSNDYLPFPSKITKVIKHTAIEYTFRMAYDGEVKPGQFFEVSLPKFGEAPISVSGIGDGTVDLTIRRVGKVTNEVFANYEGDTLFLRGPYGNGFDVGLYQGREIVIVAGGTGVSPVRGVISHFAEHTEECQGMTIITGFKSEEDILFRKDFEWWKQRMNVILTTDTGTANANHRVGLVTEFIPDLALKDVSQAVAIVVGPPAMMRFSIAALLKRGFKEENLWISQERKMCCGLGKCGHCRIGDTYVCLDGPVFNYTKGRDLVD